MKKHILLSFIFLIILTNTCFGQVYFNEDTDIVSFGNSYIEIQIRKDNGAIWSIYSKLSNIELKTEKDNSWRIAWGLQVLMPENNLYYSDSNSGESFSYQIEEIDDGKKLTLIWHNFHLSEINQNYEADIYASIIIKNLDQLSYWSISCDNNDSGKIYSITYPFITGIRWLDDDVLDDYVIFPSLVGRKFNNFWENMINSGWTQTYPSGYMNMQFTSYYDNNEGGFYLACYDSNSFIKDFSFNHQTDFMSWSITHYPPANNNNGFNLSYQTVLGVFQGDWMNAADIYKNWAEQQVWTDKKISDSQSPDWAKDISIVNTYSTHTNHLDIHKTFDDFANITIDHSRYFNTNNLGVAWGWEKFGKWSGWGDYFPPYEGWLSFDSLVTKLHNNNLLLRLFINHDGIHKYTDKWNTDNPSEHAVHKMDGSILIEDSDTEALIVGDVAVMCISTDYWQNSLQEIAIALAEHSVDMIQIDGFPIKAPRECWNSNHNHELGYGSNYYSESWLKTIEKIKQNSRLIYPDFTLCSEEFAEIYINSFEVFDSREVWAEWYDNFVSSEIASLIPLLPYIYHEYALVFGQYNLGLWNHLDTEFNLYAISRILNWGFIPSYNYTELTSSPDKDNVAFEYLLKVINVKKNYENWLSFGKMLRLPEIESSTINIPLNNKIVKANALQYSAWESQLGQKAYFFTNISNSTINFNFLGNTYSLNQTEILVLDEFGYVTSVDEGSHSLPHKFALNQNYPNPFNPSTTIHYSLPIESDVTISVYDMLGRKVNQLVSSKQPSGKHSIEWNGNDVYGNPVSTGIYFYQIQAGDFMQTKKMVLMK